MIYVKRPLPAPEAVEKALNKPLNTGLTELDTARAYYSSLPAPKKAYKFLKYKEFDVCQALDALFHGKCAYCESPYRAVDALDIEHFRPKGRVSECTHHPGYWWLAAVWRNLLPSCPACNQRRRHVQYTPGMSFEEFERELLRDPTVLTGKGNAFPLKLGNWVLAEGGDLSVEEPLLINPCERDPEQHLEWVIDRNGSVPLWSDDPMYAFVRPRIKDDGTEDESGKASIIVYGLNRSGVIRERAARLKDLQLLSVPVVETLLDLAGLEDPQGAAAGRLRKRLVKYRAALFSFREPESRFSGMAVAYIREFERELLHRLVP